MPACNPFFLSILVLILHTDKKLVVWKSIIQMGDGFSFEMELGMRLVCRLKADLLLHAQVQRIVLEMRRCLFALLVPYTHRFLVEYVL